MKSVWLSPAATGMLLGVGALATVFAGPAPHVAWMAGLVAMGLPIVFRTARTVLAGRFATDIVASLAIVGAVLLDQPLAGLVIVLMQTSGEALERHAKGRASKALRALDEAAPRMTRAAESQYERVVDLVCADQATKAPIQRLADRYAAWFTPATLIVCALVVWLTHDWSRALAVLVVATPCSLLLAAPVAIVGGINRAARSHIVVRHGGALERIGAAEVAVFDKTGTITAGTPRLAAVHVAKGFTREQVLRLAAAVERGSSHLLARALVSLADAQGLDESVAATFVEEPGLGVRGMVDGHDVRVGARAFVVPFARDGLLTAARLEEPGAAQRAYAAIDGRLAAVFEYADELRPEMTDVLAALRRRGVRRFVLLSGDHAPIARAMAARAGIAEAYGDLSPADKARFIERLQAESRSVMMVGDGMNDAAALATADVGVALVTHGRGGGITTEAADVIVLVDSLSRVTEAVDIGSRTLRIARQSIIAGLALSGIALTVAAFGGLMPVTGAAIRGLIDVAVIVNVLRTARAPLFARRSIGRKPPARIRTSPVFTALRQEPALHT